MAEQILGVQVQGTTITEVQGNIQKAEDLGIQGVWMTGGGASLDSMTCFAASAASTTKLKMGTSIVPTYPRHPLVMAA
ncbi:MAG: LLM class flavin-dependent oxidoreductase, partial [Dehalococcoidia bacterium]|nr:LLM class flavin-dependent oxidoreductase [Dehalococcoidia bacterium]